MSQRIFLFVFFLFSCLNLFSNLKTYQFPEEIPRSDKYQITLKQGRETQTAFVHISNCPEQKHWREKILPLLYDRSFSWTSFEFDSAPVEVTVTKLFGDPAMDVVISPQKYGIMADEFDGHTVRFIMKKPEYISVEFVCGENTDEYGQIRNGLMIFADVPQRDVPHPDDPSVVPFQPDERMFTAPVIYFGPGVYNLTELLPNGVLPLHDNQTVYIHPEAYIYGGLTAPSTYNVKVYGRGILDGQKQVFRYPGLPQLVELEPWNHRTNVHRGGNATVEGITFLHSYKHNCAIGPHSYLKDLKFIAWTVNSDGIRSGDNCVIDHVFMKVSDDHLYAFSNSLITNSVFWPMWNGAILQLSWGNYGGGGTRFIKNVVINPEYNQLWANNGIIASMARPHAKFEDILIQDLIVEGDINALANLHYSTFETNTEPWTGYIKNITFRNIEIRGRLIQFNQQEGWYNTIPEDISFDITPETPVKRGYDYYRGYKDTVGNIAPVKNVVYENVRVNGVFLTMENYSQYVHIDEETTDNFQFIRSYNSENQPGIIQGEVLSNSYSLEGIGAGSHPAHPEDVNDIARYAWLKKGESCMVSLHIPEEGMYSLKVSLGYLINPAVTEITIDGKNVMNPVTLNPRYDNGDNYLSDSTKQNFKLMPGNHTLKLSVKKGYCIPGYFELSKVTVQGKAERKADLLNIGVTPDRLNYNSREEARINADERGPQIPLSFSSLTIQDFSGNSHIIQKNKSDVFTTDIRTLEDKPYTAVFSDDNSFWVAKVFVK